MAKKADPDAALEGHENLSMADQMRAAGISAVKRTSPVTGAVENPRREYMKNAITAKGAWKKSAC